MKYQDLEVWRLGVQLAKEVYSLTRRLPKEENYGLASQMRRAAVSIPSNIAEGHRRGHPKEFIQFLRQASGSLAELETQLLLSKEIYNLEASPEAAETLDALGRKLTSLIQVLAGKQAQASSDLRDEADAPYSTLDARYSAHD